MLASKGQVRSSSSSSPTVNSALHLQPWYYRRHLTIMSPGVSHLLPSSAADTHIVLVAAIRRRHQRLTVSPPSASSNSTSPIHCSASPCLSRWRHTTHASLRNAARCRSSATNIPTSSTPGTPTLFFMSATCHQTATIASCSTRS